MWKELIGVGLNMIKNGKRGRFGKCRKVKQCYWP
jgi:hypothetical protein